MAAGGELLVPGGYGGREGSDFGGTGGDFVFFFPSGNVVIIFRWEKITRALFSGLQSNQIWDTNFPSILVGDNLICIKKNARQTKLFPVGFIC